MATVEFTPEGTTYRLEIGHSATVISALRDALFEAEIMYRKARATVGIREDWIEYLRTKGERLRDVIREYDAETVKVVGPVT